MSNPQKSTMDLLANMGKPDVGEARRVKDLCEALHLPPRVVSAIDHYIEKAKDYARLAHEAKEAQEDAKEAWTAVKENAGRDEDLVDMAEAASAKPMTNIARLSTPEGREGKKAYEDQKGFLACPYPYGSESFFRWALGWMKAESDKDKRNKFEKFTDDISTMANTILKGVDRAHHEGREAYVAGKERKAPYNKKAYVEAWERGWDEVKATGVVPVPAPSQIREDIVSWLVSLPHGHRERKPILEKANAAELAAALEEWGDTFEDWTQEEGDHLDMDDDDAADICAIADALEARHKENGVKPKKAPKKVSLLVKYARETLARQAGS